MADARYQYEFPEKQKAAPRDAAFRAYIVTKNR
jgi:hypothetical protein